VQFDSLLPVVRKKPSDFFGMFEYKKEHESQILRALIYGTKLYFFRGLKQCFTLFESQHFSFLADLKPKMAAQMLPGLPAYIFFMMIRYTDHINNDDFVRQVELLSFD